MTACLSPIRATLRATRAGSGGSSQGGFPRFFVSQPHPRDAAGDASRLERIIPGRLARLDVAEPAPARARVAEDHERRGAALPALNDVGAGGILADGVAVLLADQLGQLAVALSAGGGHLEPRG